jgi:hypothetical protein
VAIGPGVLTADVPVGAVAAAERHAGTLALVRARSVAAVDALVNVLSPGRLDDTYTAAEPAAVAALAAAWRTAAATSASVAGDAAAAWGADPAGGLSTVTGPPPGLLPDAAGTAAQLRLTVLIEAKQRIAAGAAPEQALQHARQRAGRGAAGIGARTARTAHEHTLQAAGLGWARIPATNGCPWCLLLASRGPVYTSQRTAQGRVGPYHPWCRCRTLAVPRGTPLTGYLDPSSDVGALVDQAAAAWDATGTMDRYTTSPFARTQERARRGRGPAPRGQQPDPMRAVPRMRDAVTPISTEEWKWAQPATTQGQREADIDSLKQADLYSDGLHQYRIHQSVPGSAQVAQRLSDALRSTMSRWPPSLRTTSQFTDGYTIVVGETPKIPSAGAWAKIGGRQITMNRNFIGSWGDRIHDPQAMGVVDGWKASPDYLTGLMTHEAGHTVDRHGYTARAEELHNELVGEMTRAYGKQNAVEMVAEAFVEWVWGDPATRPGWVARVGREQGWSQ